MKRQRPSGFTLIESVAALAVAAIGLLALLQLQLVSMRTADKAQGLTQAVLLAQEKMAEALSASSWPVGIEAGTVEAQGEQFTWQREVTPARLTEQVLTDPGRSSAQPPWQPSRLRQLTVEVTWLQGPGDKHIRLTTYVAENGIRESKAQRLPSGFTLVDVGALMLVSTIVLMVYASTARAMDRYSHARRDRACPCRARWPAASLCLPAVRGAEPAPAASQGAPRAGPAGRAVRDRRRTRLRPPPGRIARGPVRVVPLDPARGRCRLVAALRPAASG
jgi:prepilin-type N-terminal cleavage/methylation domain-containing protein